VRVTYTDSTGEVVTRSLAVLVTYEVILCSEPFGCPTTRSADPTMSFYALPLCPAAATAE